MLNVAMSDVTQILQQIESGDPSAGEHLLPLVYDELRKLAAARMAEERSDHTLQATALVHEAYVRLVDTDKAQHWDSRGHFFSAAAEAMRRILVENARRKQSLRRGGGASQIPLDQVAAAAMDEDTQLLVLNEALTRLEQLDSAKAEVVKLRYFAGLTIPQTAEALRISITTANRYWSYARAWLHEELQAACGDSSV